MTDYSQSNEQAMILEWADRHGSGRFLDLGAADGVAASNSRALALAGWSGVCVEPAAVLFDKLAMLYRDRPDVECVQAAVVHKTWGLGGLVPFHYSHDLVSTTEDANAETWAELVSFTRCYVAAVTVKQLLDMLPGPYDFVSVDTEGTSVELFYELVRLDAIPRGGMVVVEAENGGERWELQRVCLDGFARLGVTPNNIAFERL